MSTTGHTVSEALFEEHLRLQGMGNLMFEKEHSGKSQRPDYTVEIEGKTYLFEVKEFDRIRPFGRGEMGFSGTQPTAVREKINQAAKKFHEFKELPCCLVLYNCGNPFVDLDDPQHMFGAMYGDPGITMDWDRETGEANSSTARFTFLDGGKMFRPHWQVPQNTTLSAIITLRRVPVGPMRLEKHMNALTKSQELTIEDSLVTKVGFDKEELQLGVIVWENMFARIRLSRDLFRGPYDERYGQNGNVLKRVFAGSALMELET
jgi:hypothetical protein